MEHGVLRFRLQQVFRRQHLMDMNAVQAPAMRLRNTFEFGGGFGQRDVHHGFAVAHPFHQKLQAGGGFTSAGLAFDQINPVGRQASAQNAVQPWNARRQKICLLEVVHEKG